MINNANENPNHWSFDNGVLFMQVQEGNIFGAGSNDVDNLFIHTVSKTNYSAEVTISLDPNLPFEQAGLGIYWDNDNYVKISKEMFMGDRSLVFVVEQNGQPEIKKRLLFDKESCSVMLEKSENSISAYFRSDTNTKWQLIDSTHLPATSYPEQGLMLYTFSGSLHEPKLARFSEFQLIT